MSTAPLKAIEVINIVKRYGNFTAVDGVSLAFWARMERASRL
jgi:ABC-type multidrug transport system ATPase subunit